MRTMTTGRVLTLASATMAVVALALFASACGGKKDEAPADAASHGSEQGDDQAVPAAVGVASLAAVGGSGVTGRVIFTSAQGETAVVASVQGLSVGDHGFHIHENGDCGDSAKAAGGHFNPESHPHGALTDPVSHAGDLGNLLADATGNASANFVTKKITVGGGGPTDIVGRAVIVHEKADDLASQPTGAAGGRIACGVIARQAPGAAPSP